jgi:uncharacterized protein
MKKADKPSKIIVDSNIWISFLIGKSLKGLQNYIDAQKVLIVTCPEQIQELTEVFQKPKIKRYFTTEQVAEFFELLDESSVYVGLKTKTNLCRDVKDNYLLSLAMDSNADFLITGDNDLLVLENVKKTRIVKFKDFENIIK